MASAAPAGERFDLGRVFSGAFASIARNLAVVGGFALAGQLILAVASGYGMTGALEGYDPANPASALGLFTSAGYWFSILASTVGGSFIQAGLLGGFLASGRDGGTDFGTCLSQAVRYFLPVLALNILWVLAISIGLMLLVVPGVLLIVMWSASLPALVGEDAGVFGSFGRSRELTKGNWLMIFLALVLLALILGFVSFAGQGFSSGGLIKMYQSNPLVGIVVATIMGTISSLLMISFLVALYRELRLVKEGGDDTGLAEIFA